MKKLHTPYTKSHFKTTYNEMALRGTATTKNTQIERSSLPMSGLRFIPKKLVTNDNGM